MMACPDEEALLAFAHGDLRDANVRAELAGHLDGCEPCRWAVSTVVRDDRSREGPRELHPPGFGPPLRQGDALGRFIIEGPLGAGGMGVLYVAHDPELQRRVALKLLRALPESPDAARALESRLRREAQALARLSHPNVLHVYDVGVHDGQLFLALELIDGVTVDVWMKERPRTWRDIVSLFVQAGDGLAAAHAVGLVHRDVKPNNILVGKDGRVRVTDFGLAASASTFPSLAEAVAKSGFTDGMLTLGMLGTPAFMSPEQQAGQPVDARSDQFSFCLSLATALDGLAPPGTPAESARRSSRVPSRIWRALERGMSVDPAKRFDTLETLLRELRRDPERTRRRTAVLLATTVAAIALCTLTLRALERRSTCGPTVEIAWNAQRSAQIRSAFEASNAPFAAEATKRVLGRLDHYARAWTTARNDACRESMGEPGRLAKLQCLGDRLDELDALARLLGAADKKTVQGASQAAEGLSRPAMCANATEREDSPARPLLHKQLAEDRALQTSGKWPEALAKAEALAKRAEDAGEKNLALRARLSVGDLQMLAGKFNEARETLWEALKTALSIREQETAARAAERLAMTLGNRLNLTEEGAKMADLAESLGAPLSDSLLRASTLQVQGLIAWRAGRLESAAEKLREALELREKALGPDHPEVGNVLENLAVVEGARGKLSDELAAHERARAIFETRLGHHHPFLAGSLSNAAMTLESLGRNDEALVLNRRALEILETTLGKEYPAVAQQLNNLGSNLNRLGQYEEAMSVFERSLAIKRKTLPAGHPELISTMQNQCSALTGLGDYARASVLCARALELVESVRGPDHPSTATSLLISAKLSLRLRRYEEAEGHFQRALAIHRNKNGGGHPTLETPLIELGALALRRGDKERARTLLLEAKAIQDAHGVKGMNRDSTLRMLGELGGDT